MSIRENFNETAFFYPNLITNEDGSLTFSFTMPDALTRWNLMMLAYTKDLKVGTLNKTFTTSKPLMIMSDMPRFVYENDTLWIVANVISQQSAVSGQQSADNFPVVPVVPVGLVGLVGGLGLLGLLGVIGALEALGSLGSLKPLKPLKPLNSLSPLSPLLP